MIARGYSVKEHKDPFVDVVEAVVKGFSESLEPAAYLVGVVPPRESSFRLRWRCKPQASLSLSLFPSHPQHAPDFPKTFSLHFIPIPNALTLLSSTYERSGASILRSC